MNNKRKSSDREKKVQDLASLINNKHPRNNVVEDSNPTVNYFGLVDAPPLEISIVPIIAPTPNPPTHRQPRAPRARQNPSNPHSSETRVSRAKPESQTIPAPYPWATDQRARVHSMDYLTANGIDKIEGNVQCKKCEKSFTIEYDFKERFSEIATYIANNKYTMHQRAPPAWMSPNLPTCNFCGHENSCKPLIGDKDAINWLFLLLGQLLGCCTLEQLKFFCKHTKIHRTGAKDRILYLTYLELCNQFDPTGPFEL